MRYRALRAAGLLLALFWLGAPRAHASCNVIPAATLDFRAALGSTNRPFASPGDFVELRVVPAVCDGTSTGFSDVNQDGRREDDHVVTLLFVPPQGTANAVVLAEDCTGATAAATAACDAALGAGTAECVAVNAPADPLGLKVFGPGELQFRFPDTDARLAPDGDDRTYSGPAKIAVTRVGAALPCGLAASRCADLGGDTATNGVVACVDELYRLDGTCRDTANEIDATFGHFTALPPPNDYQALVSQPGITEFRFTTDAAGNLLAPMDYKGVLLRVDDVPIPQLVRLSSSVDAFSASPGVPIALPGNGALASYSPEGVVLPQVFAPLSDPSSPGDATLFGSMDAPRTVIRIGDRACVGGPNEGMECTSGADCSGGACTMLFDFTDRYASGLGPVTVAGGPGGDYAASLESPVPLEGLVQSATAFDFVLSEALDGIDRNGDLDPLVRRTDFVATLRDKATGQVQPIGPGGAEGRATVRVRQGSFAFPAVATEGDLLAFLESEPDQGETDGNANGQVFDAVLRAYRLGAGAAVEVTDPVSPPTADASARIDGRSAVSSNDLVFFRTPEAVEALRETTRVNVSSGGVEANGFTPGQGIDLSDDGNVVLFSSSATNLVPGDTNGRSDVFVRDRAAGTTTRVSVDSLGNEGNFGGGGVDTGKGLSADGRHAAFSSGATNLVPGDTNGTRDIFVHDRQTGTTERVSLDSAGMQSDGGTSNLGSRSPGLSGDGRFVVFQSRATNLVAGDTNGVFDIFVRDRQAGTTERVSVDSQGNEANAPSQDAHISEDGRFVSFWSDADNLVPADTNGVADVFVHDRATGETVRASVSSTGEEGNNPSSGDTPISADGRFVAFQSNALNLVPGDTNGTPDVFVHDLLTRETARVSVSSAGAQAGSGGNFLDLSADGRFVSFNSASPSMVPGDGNGFVDDIFLHDRATGETTRVNVSTAGVESDDRSFQSRVSADGRFVAFQSDATNLVAGDTNVQPDIFVRGADPTDLAVDRTGDGDLDDTVLRVLDTTTGPPGTVTDLCPAEDVAVADGKAAFLRPESAGATTNASCTGFFLMGPDLNLDADSNDRIVHLYDGTSVANLRCAATRVDLSATRLAALVSEADSVLGDRNGDGDTDDAVLAVRPVNGMPPALSCSEAPWLNVAQAGDALGVSGDVVALVTPEADQDTDLGGADLNGDGDATDRVLRLVDGTTGALIPIVDDQLLPDSPQAAEEFVLGSQLVAFRTPECAQAGAVTTGCPGGGTDLNGDGDAADDVLQVYVLATGERINTGQAVTPCDLVACDPRRPYRVSQDTVRFLTFESDQGEDLNDDGDQLDLLVQVFNVPAGEADAVTTVADTGATVDDPATAVDPLAAPAPEGGDSGGEQVAIVEGRCVEDTAVSCTASSQCGLGEICFPETGPSRSCVRDTGRTCLPDAPAGQQGCSAEATCVADFAAVGVADADGDEVPDALDNCPRDPNVSQVDLDADGVGDACDLQTCGANGIELDEECDDGNLVDGDGCDSNCRVTACGNGVVTAGEACDDGNPFSLDGCSAACAVEPCHDGADNDTDGVVDFADPGCGASAGSTEVGDCQDGLDNDGDGKADFTPGFPCLDPFQGGDCGCADLADASERDQTGTYPCDDGVDNDGDLRADYDPVTRADPPLFLAGSGDPTCNSALAISEMSICSNGINDDDQLGDPNPGKIDYDGGESLDLDDDGFIDAAFNPLTPPISVPDPACTGRPTHSSEVFPPLCGLGFELAPLLAGIALARRRRRLSRDPSRCAAPSRLHRRGR